ncbi:Na+/H+ antiporter NhaC family protein [Campylobacter sp. MG1]|uniref:Na+/H+ antiporter NhaC family protein n=1 Tax=Campylobacter sp. MG1 TaxID=2976332 RepID=UPI00226CC623|nr:Na+/H+ antiporter NhaC family protein [Campylobacter sp. MG1]
MLTNPVLISVIIMLALCVLRFNVFLAILVSGLIAGLLSVSFDDNFLVVLKNIMNTFIDGMSGNLQTSLSYVLVGALAIAVSRTNLTAFLVNFISKKMSDKRMLLLASLAFISCFSQNIIPIHIAFIPILIPPMLSLFNKLKIDRRAVACAVTFGLTTPYMTLPVGFGLIFQDIIAQSLNSNGVKVTQGDVAGVVWLMFFIMVFGLIASFIYFRKPREYQELEVKYQNLDNITFGKKEISVGIGLLITLAVQIFVGSLPLSALLGFLFICVSGGIEYKKIDEVFLGGFSLMGYVAFIMLIACGFGAVLKSTGAIEQIVEFTLSITTNKLLIAFGMMCIGLLITLGIGSSFGTVPIIATLFVPICTELGFSAESIIFIIACAGAVGDTGSPASEATLGVTVGLNADNQSDHIKDVCIPTFIFYNIPLIIGGALISYYL